MDRPVTTWQEAVAQVRQALATASAAVDTETDEVCSPGRVLLVADSSAARGVVQTGPRSYGLHVGLEPGKFVLHTVGDGITGTCLTRLAGMYRRVLQELAYGEGDAKAVCLPEEELKSVLTDWGIGPAVERGPDTAVDLFQAQAARTPDDVAVRASGTQLTYRELDVRSNQVARHLMGLGARPDAPVGVCLRRTPDLLPVLLGIWKSGAAYLPLDIDLPAERLRGMLAAAGCELVVTCAEHLPALEPVDRTRFVVLDEARSAVAALPGSPPGVRVSSADLAYLIFTSGSTGAPKGVMVQHGGLANYLLWAVDEYVARGTGGSPFFSSISFDLGIPSLFAPLLAGQCVHLLPDPLDTADLGELLTVGAPYSFIKLTPGHLHLLSLDLSPEEIHGLAGLVVAAGDAFPAGLAERWNRLAGPGGTLVGTEYGPTEITIGNSGAVIRDGLSTELVPLGAPIPNTTMYVLTDRLEPVPIGVPGEICVGGAGVTQGYLGDPALTADRFVPDPYGPPGARLYRTGDRGRWWAGALEFLGRTDNQLKIRGYRVELGEVREALRRRHGVGEAEVIAHQRPSGSAGLAAFVVPSACRPLDIPTVRQALARELPEFMVPSEIVVVDRIPLTANGKVDARALKGML
ncbi:amino acid adenylation domain-containing protein [Streptomyces sp. NPDC006602]|uniref:amino acid adenylation domain-containing protein n=1 Tax=Streptomyces sp. NPDC006602 TaxID=3364751 RepID=UPI0036A5087A